MKFTANTKNAERHVPPPVTDTMRNALNGSMWKMPNIAPMDSPLLVEVNGVGGPYRLSFPVVKKVDGNFYNMVRETKLEVKVVRWQHWTTQIYKTK